MNTDIMERAYITPIVTHKHIDFIEKNPHLHRGSVLLATARIFTNDELEHLRCKEFEKIRTKKRK
ncbi:MAG: hypothetical protein FWD49_00880 [Firmicutes bacterium]|nr:hypothetical protein [Bacillota bacterium]